jgi:Sulfatase
VQDIVLPASLVVAQLCLFGPQTIYVGNVAEFSTPFWTLARPLVVAGGAIVLVLAAVGLRMTTKSSRYYIALLFSVGLALWIQGNLLVADYGVLDGREIDWTIESWRNPYEIALWILVPLLSIAAARHVAPIAPFASAALLTLQTVVLMASALDNDARAHAKWHGPLDSMFDLSRTKNVIHIVLDGFQSDVFDDILREDRERLDKSLSGAVFFADHAGAFPTTIASIPAMLTGDTSYRNEQPLQSYFRDRFEHGSLFKSLRAAGYRVDNITGWQYDNSSETHVYRIQRPYVSYREYTQFTAWELADLSLFRHAPHVLRERIFNDQKWRLQQVFGPRDTSTRRYHSGNGAAVLDDFARRLTPAVDGPLYKFMHVGIPHLPVVLNANCEFIGAVRSPGRVAYRGQARCAVTKLTAVLDRLKELGLYDSSLIVISSDHGIGHTSPRFTHDQQVPSGALSRMAGKALALLIVKPPNGLGPVRTSYAPSTISDVPATVMDILGVRHNLPGEPALRLAENASRTRTFAMYDWEGWTTPYFDALDVMEINGRVLDGDSWSLKASFYPPDKGEEARARGLYQRQRNAQGVVYRWGSPHVFLHAPSTARSFEVTVRSIAVKAQTVTVSVDDRVIDRLTLSDHRWVTLKQTLPVVSDRSNLWIALTVNPSWKPRGSRELGVMVRDLKWMK